MVPAGNKAKCLLSVNHTTITIHHQFIINLYANVTSYKKKTLSLYAGVLSKKLKKFKRSVFYGT